MHVIKVPAKYQDDYLGVLVWLYNNFKSTDFRGLFYHREHQDGRWHTHCKYILGYVEFDNEEDAMAFKLYYHGENANGL